MRSLYPRNFLLSSSTWILNSPRRGGRGSEIKPSSSTSSSSRVLPRGGCSATWSRCCCCCVLCPHPDRLKTPCLVLIQFLPRCHLEIIRTLLSLSLPDSTLWSSSLLSSPPLLKYFSLLRAPKRRSARLSADALLRSPRPHGINVVGFFFFFLHTHTQTQLTLRHTLTLSALEDVCVRECVCAWECVWLLGLAHARRWPRG